MVWQERQPPAGPGSRGTGLATTARQVACCWPQALAGVGAWLPAASAVCF